MYLAGRSKLDRWQSEFLLPTCDSKDVVSQEHVWGPAGGTKVSLDRSGWKLHF